MLHQAIQPLALAGAVASEDGGDKSGGCVEDRFYNR
jgi:hypothetical protein